MVAGAVDRLELRQAAQVQTRDFVVGAIQLSDSRAAANFQGGQSASLTINLGNTGIVAHVQYLKSTVVVEFDLTANLITCNRKRLKISELPVFEIVWQIGHLIVAEVQILE